MTGKTEAGTVRDFERGDIEAVAQLFQETFRKSKAPSPSLIAYLEEAFFDHPWAEPDIRSKVFAEADGRVSGFIGVFPSRLELDGRPLRAAFAGSMMVRNPKENPLAGARLLRSFLTGPQDISLTETANATALGMWQKAGHPLDPGYSMNWLRILRPASAAVEILARRLRPATLLRPLGRIADRGAALTRMTPLRPADRSASRITFRDVTREEFGTSLLTLALNYPLRPRWDGHSLGWFLRQAEDKRSFGYPEWRVGFAPDGRPVAAYVYFAGPGEIGWLLQALSAPNATPDLLDDLFAHAYEIGCSGIRGSGHPWLTPALMSRKTIFYGRSFYVAQARDKSLLEPIRSGQALISGLAGESWTRLIGDRFD
ncbi:Hypothetical protein RG1141_CH00930 [Neorhizobium galegae bv. officinalis bv. officinalis str. HAMBI 1141]|uniref:GNAT family N-acetyltransferase n=1 Tax=Neorhizobium galegae bv. officinalis bv. officinalis str. HAMBI 1141 TaxID=1028801 RepID=A0A068T574_NEOGA|nr:hypothetical protein [Neorhizobium galegae]CDN52460.1 Hypothetical protein RG1141_CH00930 [Neorhizobium galegae bv. officinalis bv. officinalis str. HAMBI 1141]